MIWCIAGALIAAALLFGLLLFWPRLLVAAEAAGRVIYGERRDG